MGRVDLPLIIGQAPARGSTEVDEHGILVPFQGRSGDRLRHLAGVEDLRDHFVLWNIFNTPSEKTRGKGDPFDMPAAREKAARMMTQIHRMKPPVVLLMGRKVEKAFGFRSGPFLVHRRWQGVKFVVFPHPSGVSHWWNDWNNREAAAWLLRTLVRQYGPYS